MVQIKEGGIIGEVKRRTTIFSDKKRQLNEEYDEKHSKLEETLLKGLGPKTLEELMERNAYGPGLTKEEESVAHLLADELPKDDKEQCWVCPKDDKSLAVAGMGICSGHIHYALFTRK